MSWKNLHIIHKCSLCFLGVILFIYKGMSCLSFSPSAVMDLQPVCIKETPIWRGDPLHLLTWDLSGSLPASHVASPQVAVTEVVSSPAVVTGGRSIHKSAVYSKIISFVKMKTEGIQLSSTILMFQGVSPELNRLLSRSLSISRGCVVYTPTWMNSRWSHHLHSSILSSLLPDHWSPVDQGLWTWTPYRIQSAQRWALPAQPGRWPQRIFHLQPAGLSVHLESSSKTEPNKTKTGVQIINLQLPDGIHKHHAATIGLHLLDQPPLRDHLTASWILGGSFYVTPPNTPIHPTEKHRFQRADLNNLYKRFNHFPPLTASPEHWGRWRSVGLVPSSAAIIDLFFSVPQGHFSTAPSINTPLLEDQLKQLPWIGIQDHRIKDQRSSFGARAPLWVKWSPNQGSKTIKKVSP